MIVSAKDLKTFVSDGRCSISFECSWKAKSGLEKLKSGDYELSIIQRKEGRSKAQNRYLWELIGQICMKENGNTADDIEIYCQLIEQSGAKCEYLMTIAEDSVLERLKKVYRAVRIVETRSYNGKNMWVLKCFYGSSKMDKSEMSVLIDKTIERAELDGIDTEPWKERFNDSE